MNRGCDRFAPMLTRLLDGELDDRRRAELERHLAGCARCRQEFEELQSLRAIWREAPAIESQEADRAAILAEGLAHLSRGAGWLERIRAWMTPADWITAAAVAASVVLGILLIEGSHESATLGGPAASTPVYTVAEYRARFEGRPLEREERFRLDAIPGTGSADSKEVGS